MKPTYCLLALLVFSFCSCSTQAQDVRTQLENRARQLAEADDAPGISIAVLHKGDTLLMKGYGYGDIENQVPATEKTVYRIGSITKQFTAAAIMRLVEEGKVGLQDPISTYIPDYPEHGASVTVHQLLNHTSGIVSYTSLGLPFWSKARLNLSHRQVLELFKDAPLQFEPGSSRAYNNSGYYLLGMIIEKASGQTYEEFLQDLYFTPLGLASTSYCDEQHIIPHRSDGYGRRNGNIVNAQMISMNLPFAAGALCSTVKDLVTWKGAFVSGDVVSEASYKQMITPTELSDGSTYDYGYGLDVGALNGHTYIGHGGGINGFTTYLSHYPDHDLTIVVLTNIENGDPFSIEQALAEIVLTAPAPNVN